MKEYKVIIEETVSEEFKVVAESEEDARKIAEKRYQDGEFVLSPGNLVSKKMAVVSEKEEAEWVEF